MTNSSWQLFCLENIDCAETKDKYAMKIPWLKYYTEAEMLDIIAAVKKGVKVCTNYMHMHSCIS